MRTPRVVTGLGAGLLVAGLASHAAAQGTAVRLVQPGAVVTIPVTLTPPTGHESDSGSVRYVVRPGDAVRVFGDSTGEAEQTPGRPAVISLTFALSRDAPAGEIVALRVAGEWPGGGAAVTTISDVKVRVAVARKLVASIEAPDPRIAAGHTAQLRYKVVNDGNAPDTLQIALDPGEGWRGPGGRRVGAVPSGGEVTGALTVTAAAGAIPGSTQPIELVATGLGGASSVSTSLHVVSDAGSFPGFARLPTTLFAGAATDPERPGSITGQTYALSADGEIVPGTGLSLAVNHYGDGAVHPALQREVSGARLRLAVRRPTWNAAVGDITTTDAGLAGTYWQGRGGELHWTGDRVGGDITLGQAESYYTTQTVGHLALARLGARTAAGRLGITLSGTDRPGITADSAARSMAAGVFYEMRPSPTQALNVEGGLLRVSAPGGESVVGLAGQGSYMLRGTRGNLVARGRITPGVAPGTSSQGNEGSLGGFLAIGGGFGVSGYAFAQSLPLIGAEVRPSTQGTSAGVRYGRGGVSLDVSGNFSATHGTGLLSSKTTRETVTSGLRIPLGPLALDATSENGVGGILGVPHDIRIQHAALRWSGSAGWMSTGVSYTQSELGAPFTMAELGGSLRSSFLAIEGSAQLPVGADAVGRPANFWGAATLRLAGGLGLVVGTQYEPWTTAGGRWRHVLGVRQQLSTPLPIERPPVAEGIVFDDLNGNHRRDANEPGIAGVAVTLGYLRATTDHDGRYVFRSEVEPGSAVSVDAATLAEGLSVTPDFRAPLGGRADIPVVRLSSARLRIVLTRQLRAARAAEDADLYDELRAAAGAVVTMTDAQGRERDLVADEKGAVRVAGLAPGTYRVTVHSVPKLDQPIAPKTVELTVKPGADLVETILIPFTQREVRMATPGK